MVEYGSYCRGFWFPFFAKINLPVLTQHTTLRLGFTPKSPFGTKSSPCLFRNNQTGLRPGYSRQEESRLDFDCLIDIIHSSKTFRGFAVTYSLIIILSLILEGPRSIKTNRPTSGYSIARSA
jgi:hypothetical protein